MKNQPYTYGSAAPKLEPERERRPHSPKKAGKLPGKQPQRAPEPKRSPGSIFRWMLALAAGAVCIGMLLSFYVKSEKRVQQAERARSEMQRKFEEQKEVNDALQVELNRKEDLEHIRDLAINRYGMIQPEPGQVKYYNRTEQGYVRQYEEIPKETKPGK